MRDLFFADATSPVLPRNRRSPLVIAVVFHVVLFAVLIHLKHRPVRVSSAGTMQAGIAAYVPGPVGTAGSPAPKTTAPAQPKKPAMTTRMAKAAPQEQDDSNSGATGQAGAPGAQGSGTGPVRLGSGGNLTLLNRVTPAYPPVMQSARMQGKVVLDAIIHPDGTIGDIKVLESTNEAFAQSAIAAVKQWRYTAIGFEGIVTVTVNFTVPR